MKQFPNVAPSLSGSPMGREEYGSPTDCPPKSIALFKVRLYGDYDDGGAYWGGGGPSLYCARYDNVYRTFVRADNRKDALKKIYPRIPPELLKRSKI